MPGARRVLESHLSKGEVPSPGVSENHYWQDFNHYKMLYGFYYLTCEDRLDPIPQRVHPTQNNSQTAAERPRIQLNSDAVYLETVSDFTGKGFSPSRLPLSPPSDASCKSQAVPVLLTYLLQTGSSNNILLRFFWFAEVAHRTQGNTCISQFLKVYDKGFKPTAWWRDGPCKGKGCEASMPSRGTPFSPIPTCSPTQKLFEPNPFGFLWRRRCTVRQSHWQLADSTFLFIPPSPGGETELKFPTP